VRFEISFLPRQDAYGIANDEKKRYRKQYVEEEEAASHKLAR
jgi:hypothetical protein